MDLSKNIWKHDFITGHAVPAGLIIGRKSSSSMESGYVWARYISVRDIPVPVTFMPSQNLVARYGRKVINSSLYGIINANNGEYQTVVMPRVNRTFS